MQTRTPVQHGGAWLAQCVRDAKVHKIQQVIRPFPNSGGDALPVRGVVATRRIHRGEHIATVKKECVLTGQSATELLRHVCRGRINESGAVASSSDALLRPLSTQTVDGLIGRLSRLPLSSAAPPHLLLSRDALLMTTALYISHSPMHQAALPSAHPMWCWMGALPRRPPPMGVLLRQHFTRDAAFEPLTRRLRLGQQTREVRPGEDVTAASTELMVQAVESGEVGLTELRHPTVETALTTGVLTNYFKGRTSALTARQRATQRAQSGAAVQEDDAVHLFLSWEQHLQTQLVTALLSALLTAPSNSPPPPPDVLDSAAWQAEEAALRWAHFMLRSRAVNLNWQRQGVPQLSLIPLVDMLNHGDRKANVVYHCEDSGDVALTASQTVAAGEELVLRYNHIGQRGCLFGDQPRPAIPEEGPERRPQQAGRTTAATARAVEEIEKRQYHELYARDEDDDSVLSSASIMATSSARSGNLAPSQARHTNPSQQQQAVALAHHEMQQEVQWLWRYGFLRSTEEKNREAAQLWSRGLRSRIAHLTDVRRKGRPGEFVIGVPEGLQQLREQRAQLERERYANHRVFPPQQQ
ncbi:hypothetical protein ABB37_07041 [Leptomonas pyrrhocoris]|uniref:SET domain-containing protein n=1 Tax=Leptomonas pyrrhocoris TaxID=157538 RepID=A0A0M9FWU7_LEPPY|nr:hypothetical protein ABB37_07041 [Leptomonas pyrrhocoris]KPA77720.1 hypothetical protein ABB37_07041 [Leptomonas pyrrhocoris]|eukprot:XP_015656159.1 hypothetical protein ABB37_07041 [Leptomonas pyrrhocoris]